MGLNEVLTKVRGCNTMLRTRAKYHLGQVVRHKKHPFRGVVFDVDPDVFNNVVFQEDTTTSWKVKLQAGSSGGAGDRLRSGDPPPDPPPDVEA